MDENKINDGGPAFPLRVEFPTTGPHHELGMSLRDWFAGQAIVGLLGARVGFMVDCGTQTAPGYAYEIADAMLAERSKAK